MAGNTEKRVFAYVRVSTSDQAEKNTQDNQVKAINDFLKDKNVKIVNTFYDLGKSGASRDREGFNTMISRLAEVDGIAVYDDDRLARDFDMGIEQMFILKNMKKMLYVARQRKVIDFANQPHEQLFHILSAWVSAQEREKIKARQAAGIERYRASHEDWGRPCKKVNWRQYDDYKKVGLSDHACSKLLGVDWRTLRRRKEQREKNLAEATKKATAEAVNQ